MEAADIQEDVRVLLSIKDQDLLAIEVKYYESCYRFSANPMHISIIATENTNQEDHKSQYDSAANDREAEIKQSDRCW